jgi:hypothetical protein
MIIKDWEDKMAEDLVKGVRDRMDALMLAMFTVNLEQPDLETDTTADYINIEEYDNSALIEWLEK